MRALLALDEFLKSKRLSPKITVAHLDHGLRARRAKRRGVGGNLAHHL